MSVFLKVRKDGTKAWYYDFMCNGTRYRGVGGTTKTQAQRAQEKLRTKVLAGNYSITQKSRNPKIEHFVETFLARRQHLRSKKRDALSAKTVCSYFKGKNLDEIDAGKVEDYINFRKSLGVANATINRELACLRRMFNLAIKWGEVKSTPMKDFKLLEEPPGRTRYLSPDEAQRLLKSCDDYLRPIVITALNTGMRLQEILQLKWSNVHINTSIEPYIEIEQTKNNKKRFIPINDDLLITFERIKGNHLTFVFIGKRGEPLKSIKKPFSTALKKANIDNFRFHDLRHTFASYFLMSDEADLLSLKEILGHSSIQMVMRYAHLSSNHKRKQLNRLNGRFSDCHLFATSAPKTKKAP